MSYTFDQTASAYDYDTEGAPTNGYDISEFDNDIRGTAVVTDWNHLKDLDEDGFDDLCSDLGVIQGNFAKFLISWEDSTFLSGGESGNKYYRDLSTDKGYQAWIAWDADPKANSNDSNVIYDNSRNDRKAIYLVNISYSVDRKVMVSFSTSTSSSEESLSVGVVGDPHINPIIGKPYTI